MKWMPFLALLSAAMACNEPAAPPAPPVAPAPPLVSESIDPVRLMTFPALQKAPPSDARSELGQRLFFDTSLSAGGEVSCASCHVLKNYGIDGLKAEKSLSTGMLVTLGSSHASKETPPKVLPARNTPTVFNVGTNGTFGWDGRGTVLEDFLKEHLADERGMAALTVAPQKKRAVRRPAPDKAQAAEALAAYLRQLVTPSAWDRFVGGDARAVTAQQKRGFNTFMNVGCATCHAGPNVGGSLVQKLGLSKPWPGSDAAEDQGRFHSTHEEGDKRFFRSAPLRNVEKTGPYLHDGSIETLDALIPMMAEYQLGKTLSKDQVADIRAFLVSLTGDLPPPVLLEPPKSL